MSRTLTVYTHRADGQTALAAEITTADVDKGMGGRAGDFFVFTPGHHGAKWWERDTFLDQYEPLAPAKVDSDRYHELEGAIDNAHSAIAALEPEILPAQLTRDTFAGVDATASSPANGIPKAFADELEAQLQEIRTLYVDVRGRLEAIEMANVGAGLHELLGQFDALDHRVQQLEELARAIAPTTADDEEDDDASSSPRTPRPRKRS